MRRTMTLILCWIALSLGSSTLWAQPPTTEVDLRADPRLKILVSIKFEGMPPADKVLASLQKATGVPLSWKQASDEAKATFGQVNISNFPAWKVMQLLATKQVGSGKWEKLGDGYVLIGAPKHFGPLPESDAAKAGRKAREEKLAKSKEEFAKFHPLGLDQNLNACVSIVAKDPKLGVILDQLAAATKLKFTLADNLQHHEPELGNLQMNNARAYSVMELIAARDLDEGRWVKTAEGYRLEGVSRALKPSQIETAPPPPGPEISWIPWIVGSVSSVVVLIVVLIFWRRYKRLAVLALASAREG